MAEARSGTKQPSLTLQTGLPVTPLVDFARATRRSIVRNSYRIRNRIRDNLWPLSAWYMSMLLLTLTAMVIEEQHCPALLLVAFAYLQNALNLDNDKDDVIHFSRSTQVVICAAVSCVVAVLTLALMRQTALKCLLTWKGWLYQTPTKKRNNFLLALWGFSVRLFSGPNPSLYSFQRCLPRLPVPALSNTISKFLASMEPLLSKDEYTELEVQAREFESGTGVQLQRILWLKSWWASNYIADWWEQYVYLMGRSSIAYNSNYFGLDQYVYLPTNNRSARAAGVIWLFSNFYDKLQHEELKPIRIQNLIPLCMEQYRRALGTTRIPGKEVDELQPADRSKHVVIFYRGSYYRLDVYDKHRRKLSPRELEFQIQHIVASADEVEVNEDSAESRIAALTGAERNVWFEARQTLLKSDINKKTMTEIETAMTIVSLSPESPTTLSERSHAAFHGSGSNIWYDKSVSFTCYSNGRVSLCVEHSWGDAPVVGHLMEGIFPPEYSLAVYKPDGHCAERCDNDRIPWHKRLGSLHQPAKLSWQVVPEVERTIMETFETLIKMKEVSRFETFVLNDIGKQFITRKAKCSPDSFIQMVIQTAYFRDTGGEFALTYEAAMTRLFRNGRTETIRSVSKESCETVRAMESKDMPAKEKVKLLRNACSVHQATSRDAMVGNGLDRHLFALYVVCKGLGKESSFLKRALSFPWMISTSQQPIAQNLETMASLDDPALKPQIPLGGGFMAVADNGYGISYNVVGSTRLQFHVSSTNIHLKKTDAKRMADHIQQVFVDWKEIIEEAAV